ncbi:uncharacterized protein LAESUDRAFT_621167, partial [Laetiporus sulphureus 93-53]
QSYNRNPTRKNQHKNCPTKDDPRVAAALIEYQHHNITDKFAIRDLLLAEHRITMRYASQVTTQEMPETQKRQLLLDELVNDPMRRQGPQRVKESIAMD